MQDLDIQAKGISEVVKLICPSSSPCTKINLVAHHCLKISCPNQTSKTAKKGTIVDFKLESSGHFAQHKHLLLK